MMTRLLTISLSVILLMATSCQKDELNIKNPDVTQFVRILKTGNYFEKVGYELPNFSKKHLPELLNYLKDTTNIKEFPTHPLSSKFTTPKRLNECLFWTIDGIRSGNKYPSLEPCLVDTSTYSEQSGYSRVSGKKLIDLSNLYISWYEEYIKNPTELTLKKNLFEQTSYKWN
ncbi:MAG: DUF4943 family protein [Bacteroidales bacterium]|nr:DUF4943 family protein [Bacteroidales bacterium]